MPTQPQTIVSISGYGAQNGLKLLIGGLIYILEDWECTPDQSSAELYLDTGDIGDYIFHIKKWILKGTLKMFNGTLVPPPFYTAFNTPPLPVNGSLSLVFPMIVKSASPKGGSLNPTSFQVECWTAPGTYPTS